MNMPGEFSRGQLFYAGIKCDQNAIALFLKTLAARLKGHRQWPDALLLAHAAAHDRPVQRPELMPRLAGDFA